ncbi:MAG: hypothetical protein IPM23_05755 [Candidatus Melainabacteria bacterium]|nr:hypothetical protein [Candidatus Melainabacteria bacterium]
MKLSRPPSLPAVLCAMSLAALSIRAAEASPEARSKSSKPGPKRTKQSEKTERGWRLYQDTVQGPVNLFITPKAVRVEILQSQFNVIARAPSWKSIVFSPTSRSKYLLSLDDLSTRGENTGFNLNDFRFINARNSTRLPGSTLGKIPVERVTAKVNFELKSNILTTFGTFMGSSEGTMSKPKNVRGVQYFYTRAIKLDPGSQKLITSFYKTPTFEGVPVGLLLNMAETRQQYMIFRTIKIESIPCPDNLFREPPGLKLVDNIYKVMGDRYRILEDMGRDMGLGDPFGGKGSRGKIPDSTRPKQGKQ